MILSERDLDTAKRVLQAISSRNIKNLYVALKPKYLETYRELADGIPELYSLEIVYDKERFREMVKSYGTSVSEFRELYNNHVASYVNTVSAKIWQKEPIPLAVIDYYKQLKFLDSKHVVINPISEAEKLLHAPDYYEYLFSIISKLEQRRSDVEFLYTLKLCYELGIDRSFDSIKRLQVGIFGSEPCENPLRTLGNWIYLSGRNYAMHDSRKEAIKLDDYVTLKIMNYVAA